MYSLNKMRKKQELMSILSLFEADLIWMVYAAVRSKAVVLLLLIHSLLLLPLFTEALCLAFVLLFSALCPSCVAITLIGRRKQDKKPSS